MSRKRSGNLLLVRRGSSIISSGDSPIEGTITTASASATCVLSATAAPRRAKIATGVSARRSAICFTQAMLSATRYILLSNSKQRRSDRSEEHTSELQSRQYLVCRLLLEKKKTV